MAVGRELRIPPGESSLRGGRAAVDEAITNSIPISIGRDADITPGESSLRGGRAAVDEAIPNSIPISIGRDADITPYMPQAGCLCHRYSTTGIGFHFHRRESEFPPYSILILLRDFIYSADDFVEIESDQFQILPDAFPTGLIRFSCDSERFISCN
jgi:hypothetical protein